MENKEAPLAIRFTVIHFSSKFLSQSHIQTKVIVWQGTQTCNIKYVNYRKSTSITEIKKALTVNHKWSSRAQHSVTLSATVYYLDQDRDSSLAHLQQSGWCDCNFTDMGVGGYTRWSVCFNWFFIAFQLLSLSVTRQDLTWQKSVGKVDMFQTLFSLPTLDILV